MTRGRCRRRPREEAVHERDRRLVSQGARIAAGDDPLRDFVQNDAAVGHEEDARQLVGDDDDGDAEVAAQGEDQLIELVSGDRIEARQTARRGTGDRVRASSLARSRRASSCRPRSRRADVRQTAPVRRGPASPGPVPAPGCREPTSTSSAGARDSRRASSS